MEPSGFMWRYSSFCCRQTLTESLLTLCISTYMIHMHIFTYACTCMYVYMCTYIYTYICMHMYVKVYLYIYIHTTPYICEHYWRRTSASLIEERKSLLTVANMSKKLDLAEGLRTFQFYMHISFNVICINYACKWCLLIHDVLSFCLSPGPPSPPRVSPLFGVPTYMHEYLPSIWYMHDLLRNI